MLNKIKINLKYTDLYNCILLTYSQKVAFHW